MDYKNHKTFRRLFIASTALLVAHTALAQVAASRLPAAGTWSPGIPGGIPNNYTMYCNVRQSIPGSNLVAKGDGVTDDAPAIQAAVSSCPNNKYVYIPTGTYRLNSTISKVGSYNFDSVHKPFSILIKGDGPTKTKLLSYASGDCIVMKSPYGATGDYAITSGNTRGSTSVKVATQKGVVPNQWILIKRDNAAAGGNYASYMNFSRSQWVKVTSVSGTGPFTINFTPALNEGFTGDRICVAFSPPLRSGIESLRLERKSTTAGHNIMFNQAQECWLKNVESVMAVKWHFRLQGSAGCEVRECYVHDTPGGGGDSGYGVGLMAYSCNNLIENNMAYHCRHSYITEWGGQNNVIAYNFSKDPLNQGLLTTDYLMGDLCHHGGEPRYNLWEGNVAATIKFDCVLGGSNSNTVFRNQVTRKGLPSTYVACYGSDIQKWNYNSSLVANVYENKPTRSSNALRRWGTTQDNASTIDSQTQSSTVLDGEHNMADNTTQWASSARTFRNSYYLAAKPYWWDSGSWPSIGPDCSPKDGRNPAARRWDILQSGGTVTIPNPPTTTTPTKPSAPTSLRVVQ